MGAGFRDILSNVPGNGGIAPGWLADGGPSNPTTAGKLMYNMGLAIDALIERANEGVLLRFPGYGDPSGLPYSGLDRLIPQGFAESPASYAARLKLSWEDWQRAGSPRSVLQQLLGFLTPFQVVVRTVDDSSNWNTYIAGAKPQTDGPSKLRPATPNWNWDGEADTPGVTAWWRWWLVLQAGTTVAGGTVTAATNATPIAISTNAPHGLATGAKVVIVGVNGNLAANGNGAGGNGSNVQTVTVTGASSFTLNGSAGNGAYTGGGVVYALGPNTWATPDGSWDDGGVWDDGGAWDLSVKPSVVTTMRNIVNLWMNGSWCRWMIIGFDPGLFDPAQPADGTHNPAGTFAHWGHTVGSSYVPARFGGAAYCDGVY